MPNFDQTGPNGQGQMTGRGLGNCQKPNGFMRGFRKCCPFFGGNRLSNATNKDILNQEIENTKEYLKELEQEKQDIEKQ
jgi:hypothetical protein